VASVCIQMGHVPRRTGATGTHREQEFTRELGQRLFAALHDAGHHPTLIGADDAVPRTDAFVALHCDGSTNPARRGASVGYPDARGAQLAAAWKRAHQRCGYAGGFLRDNYTAALAGYYGFRRSAAPVRFLAEHGTTTNREDEQWLFANLDACARAHVEAIDEVFGPPPTPPPSDEWEFDVSRMPTLRHGSKAYFHNTIMQGCLVAHQLLKQGDTDMYFGPNTERALNEFKRRKGLPADGACDPATWERLTSWP
jgi:peptidoglycan hydrolase-like protein with peptidoglycan-binding domain